MDLQTIVRKCQAAISMQRRQNPMAIVLIGAADAHPAFAQAYRSQKEWPAEAAPRQYQVEFVLHAVELANAHQAATLQSLTQRQQDVQQALRQPLEVKLPPTAEIPIIPSGSRPLQPLITPAPGSQPESATGSTGVEGKRPGMLPGTGIQVPEDLDVPIAHLGLPAPAIKRLVAADIHTVSDLRAFWEEGGDLRTVNGIGGQTAETIEAAYDARCGQTAPRPTTSAPVTTATAEADDEDDD